jgi:hypothetical protein
LKKCAHFVVFRQSAPFRVGAARVPPPECAEQSHEMILADYYLTTAQKGKTMKHMTGDGEVERDLRNENSNYQELSFVVCCC